MTLKFTRGPFNKLFLLFATTIVAGVVVEVALRLFSPHYYPIIPAAYEYDPDLAFRLRPNSHMFATTDFQRESIANSLGSANFQESFEGYESLVFAVGDSYTQGAGVAADMSYPAQLDLLLNEDEQGFYVRKFGVVNLGVAGFGGEQSLRNLRAWNKRLKAPGVILYLGCDNDFEDDLAFKSGDRNGLIIAGSPSWGRFVRPLRLFFEKTQIGFLARTGYRQRVRERLLRDAVRHLDRKPSAAELEAPVLEQLKTLADEYHSHLIVSWSDESESYHWLQSWAAKEGIAFADWVPKVNSVRAAIPLLPLDNEHSAGHHRGWTNQVIAKEFARQIRAHR